MNPLLLSMFFGTLALLQESTSDASQHPVGHDCNRNGIPDEDESPADCDGNGVQDICDIYWPGSDCNNNDVLDHCELQSIRFHRADARGLAGEYGFGFDGDGRNFGRSEFDFGAPFLHVRRAWLELDVNYSWWLDGISRQLNDSEWVDTDLRPGNEFSLCCSLAVESADLQGTGMVRIVTELGCCDLQIWVSDAAVWYEGIAVDSPTSLVGFADFQTCFVSSGVEIATDCEVFDVNADEIIDATDYAMIYPPSHAP